MKYQEKLRINTDIPFGIEVEIGNLRTSSLTRDVLTANGFTRFVNDFGVMSTKTNSKYASLVKDYDVIGLMDDMDHYWIAHYENCSSHSIFDGLEVSSPILHNNEDSFMQIRRVLTMLHSINAMAGERTGAHIHIGASSFTSKKQIELLLKLYAIFEPIFYLYSSKGELGHVRKQAEVSASPVRNDLSPIYQEDSLLDKYIVANEGIENKHSAIHFKHFDLNDHNYGSSFEFRCFNGTVNEVIWQNYINLIVNFVNYVLNGVIDEDYVNYRLAQIMHKGDEWTIANLLKEVNAKLIDEFTETVFDDVSDQETFIKHIKGKYLVKK